MKLIYLGAIRLIVLTAAVGFATVQTDQKQSGTADTTDVKSSARTTAAAAQIPEPKPGPQIERLRRALEGTWSIKERLAPDTASPSGATGEGRIVWRPGPGGFSVVEDYWSRQGRRKIVGFGVFWWDEGEHGYRTIWCDSTNPGGCINFKHAARWEGSRLVLVEDYEINGKKFTFKEVFGDITSAGFTQTLYGAEAGGELKVDQTIRATKLTSRGAGRNHGSK
jgi:hypothetical protein